MKNLGIKVLQIFLSNINFYNDFNLKVRFKNLEPPYIKSKINY